MEIFLKPTLATRFDGRHITLADQGEGWHDSRDWSLELDGQNRCIPGRNSNSLPKAQAPELENLGGRVQFPFPLDQALMATLR